MGETYFIQTFGCAQNVADSEKIAATLESRGYARVDSWKKADVVVVNTCMVRGSAEDRVYGLVRNIVKFFGDSEAKSVKSVPRKSIRLIRGNPSDDLERKVQDGKEIVVHRPKIIVTGCMVGVARADKTGKILARMRERMPGVEFVKTNDFVETRYCASNEKGLPVQSEVKRFAHVLRQGETRSSASLRENDIEQGQTPRFCEERGRLRSIPTKNNKETALVVISNGCNNFCTYCVVPFARGREVSRPWEEIMAECMKLKERGVKSVMLLGQNVNSWGSDFFVKKNIHVETRYCASNEKEFSLRSEFKHLAHVLRQGETHISASLQKNIVNPVLVKHLGRYRIPTLFPHLLEAVAKMGFESVSFMSSNPWDFSRELIDVIARNKNISRTIHLPVQSGDDRVLKRMNRWYTAAEYLKLINNLKLIINNIKITTDIIVGFPGETEEQFQNTVKLCRKVKFEKAYISLYSPRPMTAASINFPDDVPHAVKKKRWLVLERMINKKSQQSAVGS